MDWLGIGCSHDESSIMTSEDRNLIHSDDDRLS